MRQRSEGEISSSMLPTRFMAGFEGDARFQHAYLETAKEIAAKRRAGSAITFEYAATRMEYWHIDVLHPKMATKPVHINGKLVNTSVSRGEMQGKRTAKAYGARYIRCSMAAHNTSCLGRSSMV